MANATENSGCSGCIGCFTLLVGLGWIVNLIDNPNTRGGTITFLVIIVVIAFILALAASNNKNDQQKSKSKENAAIPKQPNQQDVLQANKNDISKTPLISKNEINEQQQVKPLIKEKKVSIYDNLNDENICESPIEEQFWTIAQHEIPGLIPQFEISSYRVDFALPEKKIAIELDGHDYHKTKEQRTFDAQRERDLQKLGWTVIRFTGTEIYRNVHRCIKDIKQICKL